MDALNGSNSSEKNVTDEQAVYDHVTFAGGIFMLLLCCVGVYGNVLSVIIFTRRVMRSSINVLLAGLSFIDLFLLFMCIPVFITPVFFDYFRFTSRYYDVTIMLCFYPLTLIAQTCSVWTFVVISLERYLAVCRPFLVQKYVSVKRTKIVQIVVILISILYNLIRFWEYVYVADSPTDKASSDKKLYDILLRQHPTYFTVYYTALYLVTHFLLPFLIILILNVCVISAIKVSQAERRRLSHHQSNQHKTSRMIIIVTVIFALCNSLTFVLNIWESSNPNLFSPDCAWSRVAFILMDASNICIMVNSAVNFVIYLVYCRRYRLYFIYFNKRLLFCTQTKTNTDMGTEFVSCDGYSKSTHITSRLTAKISRSGDVDV